jgi:hypothetical protein
MTSQGWKVTIALAVITLVGSLATAMFANWDKIFVPRSTSAPVITPAPGGDPKSTTSGTTGRVAVQNVYNIPEARGLQIIRAQGFINVRVLRVCSNSVAAGRVREVILDNNAPVSDETALVNQFGSTGIEVALPTKLAVKISTGNGC